MGKGTGRTRPPLHDHPGPTVTPVPGTPFTAEHDADMSLAAAMIAARLANCETCQERLTGQALRGDLLMLAALAASLPHNPPHQLRQGTSVLYPLLRSRSGFMILGVLGAMTRNHRADVLADSVEYWSGKMPSMTGTAPSGRADYSSVTVDLPVPADPESFPDGVVTIRRMGSPG